MDRPVIVCGLGRVGRHVLDCLCSTQLKVVVIDQELESSALPQGVRGICGDCRQPEILREAGILDARGILVCTSDDLVNIATSLSARRLNNDVRIVVRLFNKNLLPRLGKTVTNTFALSVSGLSAPLIALTALTGEALGAFSLPDGPRQIATVDAAESHNVGKTVAQVAERGRALPIALLPADGPPQLLHAVRTNYVLAAGDRLVVCGMPRDLNRVLSRDAEDFLDVLWAGWLRRHGRVVWRTVREVDRAVLICTLVLLLVIIGSTITLHFAAGDPWGASLQTTVGVIATAGALPPEVDRPGLQVFVSFLRLSGTALTAAFTAIVTQYLLRARLGGAFEARRIPERGHVVVCGLGNVGFRVVEELLNSQEQVVVIELNRDNRFVASCRRLGAVVIVGDATVSEVLRQARAGYARAVVVATQNELANVEIALLVRELNPTQRLVVRLSDTELAETLREAAGVLLALSVPALAAPAFVAALFGDRVRCAARIAGKLLLVVEVTIPAHDATLISKSVREVALEFNVLPVALLNAADEFKDPLGESLLRAGDHLTVVSSFVDLERLYRRDTPGH